MCMLAVYQFERRRSDFGTICQVCVWYSQKLVPSETGEELIDAIEERVTPHSSLSLTHSYCIHSNGADVRFELNVHPIFLCVFVHLCVFARDRGLVLKKDRFCVSLYAFLCVQATEFVYPSGCELCRV